MTITLHLPPELETRLTAEAARLGIPLSDYVVRVLSGDEQADSLVHTGAQLVEYWQHSGIVGARRDIGDSQQHARDLRAQSERRERP